MTTTVECAPGATIGADQSTPSPRVAGLRDIAAVSPGVGAFGVVLGIAAVTTHTGAFAAALGAITVYGGSAQLTTFTLLHLGTGLVAAVLSGLVVNARVLLYGAALEPWFRNQPLWFKLLGPQFIQDQTYLSAINRKTYDDAAFRRYWAWLGGSLLVVWTGSVVAGVLLAPWLPSLPHLALVGTALFIAMLVPRLLTRRAWLSAVASGATAWGMSHVLPQLAIITGAAIGVFTAMAWTRTETSP